MRVRAGQRRQKQRVVRRHEMLRRATYPPQLRRIFIADIINDCENKKVHHSLRRVCVHQWQVF
jgi:hypothetical protein